MTNPVKRMKKTLDSLEKYAVSLAKDYDLESLAGPQGEVVYFLNENKEKAVFIKDIEKHFDISKSVASSLIKRMEKNGFVEILSRENDKRYKELVLTPLAESKIPSLISFYNEIIATACHGISKEDFDTCQKVFSTLENNIKFKEEKNV
ncbi:MAG: MarR family transcriptional regulator [Gemella sp.]|nr:MarR family transcriptional regulator [Gemella sp.]